MNTRTNICFMSKFEIHVKTWLRLMSATLLNCEEIIDTKQVLPIRERTVIKSLLATN